MNPTEQAIRKARNLSTNRELAVGAINSVVENDTIISLEGDQSLEIKKGGIIIDNSREADIYIQPNGQIINTELSSGFQSRWEESVGINFINEQLSNREINRFDPKNPFTKDAQLFLDTGNEEHLESMARARNWLIRGMGFGSFTANAIGTSPVAIDLLRHYLKGNEDAEGKVDPYLLNNEEIEKITPNISNSHIELIKSKIEKSGIQNGILGGRTFTLQTTPRVVLGEYGFRVEAKVVDGEIRQVRKIVYDVYDWNGGQYFAFSAPQILADRFVKEVELPEGGGRYTFSDDQGYLNGGINIRESHKEGRDDFLKDLELVGARPFLVKGVSDWVDYPIVKETSLLQDLPKYIRLHGWF